MIGKIINYRYEVLEKMGDGPLFSVYRSRDKVLNRLVALKLPARNVSEVPGMNESLVTGYRGAMPLAHPNIARVLDADCTEDGEAFVACEFARGINVKERVRRAGPIAAPLAVEIMIPVLTALAYAHSAGMVHGDLGAQDIIVSPDGEVKVTDFGLAGVLKEHPGVADSYVMRSVHYEAPEVIEGAQLSAGSDIYSAGVILYEMLTGQTPFDGATSVSVAMKKIKDSPANPRTLNTAIPKSLADVVMRAIETTPEGRYSSALEMLSDLKAVSEALRMGVPAVVPSAYGKGVQTARPTQQVQEQVSEKSFKSQFVTLLMVFILVCGVVMGATLYLKSPKTIVVPELAGKTFDEAKAITDPLGIELVNDGTAISTEFPAGRICSVSPMSGQTVSTSDPKVHVKISSGSGKGDVPSVVGRSISEAQSLITSGGFVVGSITDVNSDTVPAGSIVSQSPQGGVTRPAGTTINLVRSLGPKDSSGTTSGGTDQPGEVQSGSSEDGRSYSIPVDVPPGDAGQQMRVRIVLEDNNGGTSTAFDEFRDCGSKFRVSVRTNSATKKIVTYVDDKQVDTINL